MVRRGICLFLITGVLFLCMMLQVVKYERLAYFTAMADYCGKQAELADGMVKVKTKIYFALVEEEELTKKRWDVYGSGLALSVLHPPVKNMFYDLCDIRISQAFGAVCRTVKVRHEWARAAFYARIVNQLIAAGILGADLWVIIYKLLF
jgi:hypothetical protein